MFVYTFPKISKKSWSFIPKIYVGCLFSVFHLLEFSSCCYPVTYWLLARCHRWRCIVLGCIENSLWTTLVIKKYTGYVRCQCRIMCTSPVMPFGMLKDNLTRVHTKLPWCHAEEDMYSSHWLIWFKVRQLSLLKVMQLSLLEVMWLSPLAVMLLSLLEAILVIATTAVISLA